MGTKSLYSDFAIASEPTPSLALGKSQRQEGEHESFIVYKKDGFRYAIVEGCCLAKLETD